MGGQHCSGRGVLKLVITWQNQSNLASVGFAPSVIRCRGGRAPKSRESLEYTTEAVAQPLRRDPFPVRLRLRGSLLSRRDFPNVHLVTVAGQRFARRGPPSTCHPSRVTPC